jgi:hypothetical protein
MEMSIALLKALVQVGTQLPAKVFNNQLANLVRNRTIYDMHNLHFPHPFIPHIS